MKNPQNDSLFAEFCKQTCSSNSNLESEASTPRFKVDSGETAHITISANTALATDMCGYLDEMGYFRIVGPDEKELASQLKLADE